MQLHVTHVHAKYKINAHLLCLCHPTKQSGQKEHFVHRYSVCLSGSHTLLKISRFQDFINLFNQVNGIETLHMYIYIYNIIRVFTMKSVMILHIT